MPFVLLAWLGFATLFYQSVALRDYCGEPVCRDPFGAADAANNNATAAPAALDARAIVAVTPERCAPPSLALSLYYAVGVGLPVGFPRLAVREDPSWCVRSHPPPPSPRTPRPLLARFFVRLATAFEIPRIARDSANRDERTYESR